MKITFFIISITINTLTFLFFVSYLLKLHHFISDEAIGIITILMLISLVIDLFFILYYKKWHLNNYIKYRIQINILINNFNTIIFHT
jgi:hypothetical protein